MDNNSLFESRLKSIEKDLEVVTLREICTKQDVGWLRDIITQHSYSQIKTESKLTETETKLKETEEKLLQEIQAMEARILSKLKEASACLKSTTL